MYLPNINALIKHSIPFRRGEDVNDTPEEPRIYAWILSNAGGVHPTLGKLFASAFIILRHIYLRPGYSPEINPDEHVSNRIENHEIGRKLPKDKSSLVSPFAGGLPTFNESRNH
jgi:hypothetical protein